MAALAPGLPVPARFSRSQSDEELVARLRKGDEAAFGEIHDRHRAALERYAKRILDGRGASGPEDVVQDVFVRAHAALKADDRPMQLRAWLYRLTRNRCLDELRRPATGATVPMDDVLDPVALEHSDPYEATTRREELRDVVTDLASLPDRQREVLLFREVEGLSHEEVAEQLGITVRASKNLANRARENLARSARARDESCQTIRDDLVSAHERRRRASPHALRHVARCRDCRLFRGELQTLRSAMRVLDPGSALVGVAATATGWSVLGLGAGAATMKVAATAAVTVAAGAGAFELASSSSFAGDRAPMAIRSDVLAGPLQRGERVPAGTAVLTKKVVLAAGTTRHPSLSFTCPAGTRVAGMTPSRGARVGFGYAPSTIVGASRIARVVFEPRRLARATGVVVGTLCKRPDAAGSLLAVPALAASKKVRKVCSSRAYLYETPGRFVIGTVFRSQPVTVQRRDRTRRWTRITTDAGTRGWVRSSALCR
ncbi:RNA polymerase sigma factor [Conexibacter sp. SYSU D00693]|uniref:RNA polymerase sigma factor n=1 Tax=Conexibacter sp. SYSU D00693 TaxID=2812560 RepID=UPI00196A7B0C|nr:RNA polymerase sigma factor [Conexibacter sp. SYSU D00693]